MTTSAALDLSVMTPEQVRRIAWMAGDLSYMVLPYQRETYDAFWAWQATKHLVANRRKWKALGAKFHSLWVLEIGRRWGKTVLVLLIIIEFCIRRPNSVGLLCTAYQNSIGSIILKIIRTVFEPEAPPGYCPEYRTSKDGESQLLYIPAANATIKLVGLDLHSGKTRGNFQDFVAVTEAGFVTGLGDTFKSVIQPQLKGRPWSWSMFESSTSDIPDHEFQTEFIPDAELRGAYVQKTIEDTDMTPEEIELELDSVGGRDTPTAQREYFCKPVRDAQATVFPECVPALKLDEYSLPKYGLSLLSADPGQVDQFALQWSTYDVTRGQVVFLDDWAESNPNTERVAAIVAAREYDLFGTQPSGMLVRIPLADEHDAKGVVQARGWRTLLAGDRCEHLAERLHELAQLGPPPATDGNDRLSDYQWFNHATQSWKSNPVARVSDTQLQLINDLSTIYGIHISPTTKDDLKDTMVMLARAKMVQGRVAFGPGAELSYKHCYAARWNKQRTKFDTHSTYGHFDLAAATIYALRYWEQLYNILPDPPEHLGKGGDDWVGDIVGLNEEADEDELGAYF